MSWCGPYWSDGQFQESIRGYAPASSEFDETCRQHDFTYADNGDRRSADLLFARENIGRGFVRTAAGLAVGLQGVLRSVDKRIPTKTELQEEMVTNTQNKRLRGAGSSAPNNSTGLSLKRGNAPVAMGSIIRQKPPKLTRQRDGASLIGTDFLDPVEGLGVSDFGIGKSALLSPAYFIGTFLGNLARSYEKYRWKRLRIHYVPKVSTATGGQIILTSSKSVSEPVLNPGSGTFLQRAMSQGNATMGPLWMENWIDIDCGEEWFLVDPATTTDPDDAVAEELQVFTQTTSAGQVGYLYAEYEVEFMNTMFTSHATSLPIYTGPGLRCTLTDAAAVNAINDDIVLTDPLNALGLSSVANGTIFRAVLDIAGSAAGTGATLANYANIITAYRTSITVQSSVTTAMSLVGGMTLYLVVVGSSLYPYTSLESAVNGNGTGELFVRTATTAIGTFVFDVALVRYGASILPTTQ
nr:MAG: capsid protein [Crogonang virus 49]